MGDGWLTTMKPTFQAEWLSLPAKEAKQVLEKVALLAKDPTPDAKVKKQLKHKHQRLYRLRSGRYRIFYTFKEPHISLLAIRRRDDDTYDDDIVPEDLGGLDSDLQPIGKPQQPDWEKIFTQPEPEQTPFPEPVTAAILEQLKIPEACHARLLKTTSVEQLYDVPGVPDELKLRVQDYMFERPLVEVLQQPDLVVPEVDDLIKYKDGSLLGFLLKLNLEQEKFVTWALNAKGPTLVKGGPGTGKSTVALYRVKALLDSLPADPRPQILFTTYTNALVSFSQQLLEQLLGDGAAAVDVRTADSMALKIVGPYAGSVDFATSHQVKTALAEALQKAEFSGNALQRRAMRRTIERLGSEYLVEEISAVIEARGLKTLEEYLNAGRPGRRVPLNKTQRTAVWAVREAFTKALGQHVWTWQRLRRKASELVAEGKGPGPYDAVVVDEAQDLDPTALRMLADLCVQPNRLFVTADANQSIYGSGFRWTDVHASLSFLGRTGVLRANHRSTRELGEAADSYLAHGLLEEPEGSAEYVHSGPYPVVRRIGTPADEAALIARFVSGATKHLRLGTASAAVLVPSEWSGRKLVGELVDRGLKAQYMSGKELDLKAPVVKVITLKSAKGLEFPVVAVAGFLDANYPYLPKDAPDEAVDEILAQERRTIYVAMTRAMRALLVATPEDADSPLLSGFDPELWNTGQAPGS